MTEEQKKIVPYEAWWEAEERKKKYIEQSQKQPATAEEAIAWQKKIDKEAGISNPFCGVSHQQLRKIRSGQKE